MWSYALIYLLIGAGTYFAIRLGFIQFRHFHMFAIFKYSRHSEDSAGIPVSGPVRQPGCAGWNRQLSRRCGCDLSRWSRCGFLDVDDGFVRHVDRFC